MSPQPRLLSRLLTDALGDLANSIERRTRVLCVQALVNLLVLIWFIGAVQHAADVARTVPHLTLLQACVLCQGRVPRAGSVQDFFGEIDRAHRKERRSPLEHLRVDESQLSQVPTKADSHLGFGVLRIQVLQLKEPLQKRVNSGKRQVEAEHR